LAIRSSPHSTFSRAILRISSRSSFGIGGRPTRDFIRQKSLQPARCQRIIVAGCTTTNAPRQSKSLASTTRLTRVAASIRCGWTPRSMYRASCRRRKRFSVWTDSVERKSSTTQRRAALSLPRDAALGWTAFLRRTGKLLHFHGWNDPVVTPDGSIDYLYALTQFERFRNLPKAEFDRAIDTLTRRPVRGSWRRQMVPQRPHPAGACAVVTFE
jgi:hypothetical protein